MLNQASSPTTTACGGSISSDVMGSGEKNNTSTVNDLIRR